MKLAICLNLLLIGSISLADSSFDEMVNVIHDQGTVPLSDTDAQSEFQVYSQHKLPQYEMNMKSIFKFGSSALEADAKRTVTDRADYLDRLPKLLHPNGVCVVGKWEMNESSPFTGAFSAGTKNLFVGRISVAMQETTAGSDRGFGFAGKLYPTENPGASVATENFFSVDVLMGTKIARFLDTVTINEPETGFNFWLVRLGLKIAAALTTADQNPGFRPVRNLGQMGLAPGQAAKFPHWIRISAAQNTKKNNQADFRSEVLQAVGDNGELTFLVDGSDTTKDRAATTGWSNLGKIKIQEAIVSYGCDRRLHFAHPKLN